ncbi:MAG: enolase C-terminal domain-like protein [Acidimicrobiia bacterium]|nr:enolase C-terminal domain-like protein [Acidimicrobiia bacterium]
MTTSDIDRIDAWAVSLPLHQGFLSARSRIDERQLVLVRIGAGEHHGWGEAAPVPGHSSEQMTAIWSGLRSLVSTHGAGAGGHALGMLGAAFAQATDDLEARRRDLPLWRVLGGETAVRASAAIGVDRDGQPDVGQVASAAAAGYRNAKLKITPRSKPGRVAELIGRYPEIRFAADANGSLDLAERALLASLDDLGLVYIEQPGDPSDLELHRRLRRQLETPLALDEAAATATQIAAILDAEAADIINLKTGRFGTSRTLRLATEIAAQGIEVRLGGLLESGVGRAHTVALASHPMFTVPGDIAGSDRYFANDLVVPQWRVNGGVIDLPEAPGIGVTIDDCALAAASVEHLHVE